MSLVTEAWLANTTVRRCVLVKVTPLVYSGGSWSPVTYYMSTSGYITSDSSVVYPAIVRGGLKFNEAINDSDTPSVSYGDVEIYNPNGDYDNWLDDSKFVWVNREIKIYYGDPNWVCVNQTQVETDFELIFNGITLDIKSRARDTLNIMVRDKMERLNAPIYESKLGNYGVWADGNTNKDVVKPLIFGEVHNTEPLLIDPSKLEYMFNDSISEGLSEIRDNGVPVYTAGSLTTGAAVSNFNGTFKLTHPPIGQITVSAQGIKNSINLTNGSLISGTYNNNIANIIALIVTQYGRSYTRLSAEDLDLSQLNSFSSANTQRVGILADNTGVINVCQALASSIGAKLFFTRQGKLQLIKYGVPTTDPTYTITDDDILHHSLNISNKSEITASTNLGYAKNWTVQENLLSAIPDSHKDLFSTEWLNVVVVDTIIKDRFKLNDDIVQKDTMLIREADTEIEAIRLNNFYKYSKITYSFTGTSKLLALKIGQPVILKHNRFGLANGKQGQVVGLTPDWSKGFVEVEVLIINELQPMGGSFVQFNISGSAYGILGAPGNTSGSSIRTISLSKVTVGKVRVSGSSNKTIANITGQAGMSVATIYRIEIGP